VNHFLKMGLDSLIPGTEPPTDVVSYKVFINGEELTAEIKLTSVTVNKTFNRIAFARLLFLDGSVAQRDFPLSNDDKFKPGGSITIQLGYHSDVSTVFDGLIVKHAVKVKQSGASLLLIEAKDKAVKLIMSRKSVYHINKTDSEVIENLAGEMDKEIDSTSFSHKQLVQFEATDWDFIITRAEANGMFVLTDDGKLIVKQPSSSVNIALTATYGQDIVEFEAELDARKQSKTIKSLSWDYSQQQVETSDEGSADFSENGNISSNDLGNVLGGEVQLTHIGHLTTEQLQTWSDAYVMRKHLLKCAGRVRIHGKASVKPGMMVTLAGVGDRFNGNVFVTGVLHLYDGTWFTDIQFGWSDDWFYKKEDVMNKPAGGLLPGINGLQIGVVLQVDDNEDGGQYRVKIYIPTITSGNEGIWARVATLDAGDNRGAYFRPQAGDEVVLGFLNDDPREPVILGYLHSKDSKQSPLPEQDGMLQYGFVTKEKNKLIFDDTNKRITLSVNAAAGEKTIILNNEAGAIEIKDENQNTIKMDASGITIQSGMGNVIIKGLQVMIN